MSIPGTGFPGGSGFDDPVPDDDPDFGYSDGSGDDSLLGQEEPRNNDPDYLSN